MDLWFAATTSSAPLLQSDVATFGLACLGLLVTGVAIARDLPRPRRGRRARVLDR